MSQFHNLPRIDGARTVFAITEGVILSYAISFANSLGPQLPLIANVDDIRHREAVEPAGRDRGEPRVGPAGWGYGVPANATIASIPSTTSATLSAAATRYAAAVDRGHPLRERHTRRARRDSVARGAIEVSNYAARHGKHLDVDHDRYAD